MADPVAHEFTLIHDSPPTAIDVFAKWLPRIAVAVIFLGVGSQKFASQGMWVRIFAQIGLGDWFRYFTGALQVGGAILVLIPRTFAIGMLMLICTMAGAVATWIAFGLPFGAVIPGALLVGLIVVGWPEFSRIVARLKPRATD